MAAFFGNNSPRDLPSKRQAELSLARDLILKVAKIDPEAIRELFDALEKRAERIRQQHR